MKRLYRSRTNKQWLGICGGISDMTNVDATLLRVLFVVGTIFTSGTLLLVYIIASFVIPKEPPLYNEFGAFGGAASGGGWSAWQPQQQPSYNNGMHASASQPGLDAMMNDLEKKALRKEVEQYRAKLAKHEKGEL